MLVMVMLMSVVIQSKALHDRVTAYKQASPNPSSY